MITADGYDLVVEGPDGIERMTCASAEIAAARTAFVREALSWVGTPFRNCGDVRGRGGAVDCAMLLVRCAVDTGRIPQFDPRPYSPSWMLHKSDEQFVKWLSDLGAAEVMAPQIGDIVLWQFGRTYSHGGILIDSHRVVHAFAAAGMVIISRLDEPLLQYLPISFANVARPRRYFDLWG